MFAKLLEYPTLLHSTLNVNWKFLCPSKFCTEWDFEVIYSKKRGTTPSFEHKLYWQTAVYQHKSSHFRLELRRGRPTNLRNARKALFSCVPVLRGKRGDLITGAMPGRDTKIIVFKKGAAFGSTVVLDFVCWHDGRGTSYTPGSLFCGGRTSEDQTGNLNFALVARSVTLAYVSIR